MGALAGIAKSTWGPEFKYLARLFNAVAAPRMDYGAVIWYRPKDSKSTTTSQTRKLSTIQKQAMNAILRCFKTTPTVALEAETALIPPQHRLTDKILDTILRMKRTPKHHPIQLWLKHAT